jgi:hypothetical protein
MRDIRSMYKILIGNPGGNRLFGRPTRVWEDNIKNDKK